MIIFFVLWRLLEFYLIIIHYIYAAFMPAVSSFSFYPLSILTRQRDANTAHIIIVHPKSTLALALRVRDDTGPSSARAGGTGEASGGVSGG